MNINLLPWRENRQHQYQMKVMYCGLFYIIVVLVSMLVARNLLLLQLDDLQKQIRSLSFNFDLREKSLNKHNRSLLITNFLANLPFAIHGSIYMNRILLRDALIKLSLTSPEIHELEHFIQTIKAQVAVDKVIVEGAATHVRAHSDSEGGEFVLTFSLANKKGLSA